MQMGNSMVKLLSGSADAKEIEKMFHKVDKNNNGVLDFEELQQFVSKAFDVMAKSKDLGDSAIPSTHGSAVPVKQWPDAHETIRRDICTEVTTALLRVVDKDHNNVVSIDEWRAFDWSSMIPSVQQAMHDEKERREALKKMQRSDVSAPKIKVTQQVVREVDFSRMAVGRLTATELRSRLDLVGEKEEVQELNISGHSLMNDLTADMFAPFTGLKRLIALDSELKSLPELPRSLESLEVEKNRLRSLPHHIGLLTKLKKLDAQSNILRALPKEMGLLTELTYIDLRYNGELPDKVAVLFSDKGSTQRVLKLIADGAAQLDSDILEGSEDESGLRDTVTDMRHVADGEDAATVQQLNVLGLMLGQEKMEEISPSVSRKGK